MLRSWKDTSRWFCGAVCALIVAASLVVGGCGTDEGYGDQNVATKTQKAKPATPAPPPVVATTVVEKPEPVETAVPEPPKEVTYDEAEQAFFEKRYGEAVDMFTQYTDRKSENPWGFYMLGLSAWKAGENDRAEVAFRKAIELDSTHVKSYINLSRVLLDTSRPSEALTELDAGAELDGDSGVIQRLRGRAFYQLGRTDEAIAAYRRAIEIDDQDAWSMNNLALIYIEQERFDEALPALARAIQLRGDVAVFQNNFGMALEHTGRFRAAEEAYKAAAALDGSHEAAMANLARIELVVEDSGIEPVDIGALVLEFMDTVAGWKGEVVATDLPAAAEPVAAAVTTTAADSTGDAVEE